MLHSRMADARFLASPSAGAAAAADLASAQGILPAQVRSWMIVPGPDSRSSDQVMMHICQDITTTVGKLQKQQLRSCKVIFDKGGVLLVITQRDPSNLLACADQEASSDGKENRQSQRLGWPSSRPCVNTKWHRHHRQCSSGPRDHHAAQRRAGALNGQLYNARFLCLSSR